MFYLMGQTGGTVELHHAQRAFCHLAYKSSGKTKLMPCCQLLSSTPPPRVTRVDQKGIRILTYPVLFSQTSHVKENLKPLFTLSSNLVQLMLTSVL